MIAEPYFELRGRLGAALFALGRIAEEAGLPPGRASLLRQLVGSLRDPFLLVVAGEVNAGKSTFLNALFGEAFCEADVLPTTERILYFKHAAEPRDVAIDDSFVERYRNIPFLRDFHIVDTPGTNSIAEGHQEITERFIPMADLVLFVFSAANPWAASTWEFIEQIYDGWLKNVILVLQQSDLRTPDEVHAIVEHMRATARKRLNREFPVFPVSGKKAFVAKTSVHGQSDLLRESGFPALEEHISRMVVATNATRRKFRNAIHTARTIMAEIESRLRETRALLDNDRRVLETLDGEITSQYRETSGRVVEGSKEEIVRGFRAAAEAAAEALERGMGVLPSLIGRPGLVPAVEARLADGAAAAGLAASEGAMRGIERDLPGLWQRLEAAVRREYRMSLPAGDGTGAPRWLRAREGFAEEIAEHCRGALLDSESLEQIDALVENRRKGIRGCGVAIVLGALVAAGGGMAAIPALALAGGGFAVLSGTGLLFGLGRHRKAIREALAERRARAEDALRRTLETAHAARMGKYFREFLAVFERVREFCEAQRAQYQPTLDAMHNLTETFAEIETDLAHRAGRAEADAR